MNTKITIFLFFFPLFVSAQMQVEQYESFKRANTLLVQANYPAANLFDGTLEYLTDNGYVIDRYDERLGTIQLAPKKVTKLSGETCQVIISVQDGSLVLRSYLDTRTTTFIANTATQSAEMRVKNVGMKGSGIKNSFLFTEQLAVALSEWFEGETLYGYEDV